MKRFDDDVLSGTPLSPVKGVSVAVNVSGGAAASLFSDTAGTLPLANPVVTDDRGYYAFCVADGLYDLIYTKPGLKTLTRIGVEIASDLNESAGGGTTGMTRADFGDDQTVNSERGLFWKSGNLNGGYGLGRVAGAWTDPYVQMLLAWQAGIQLDPGTLSSTKSHVEILNNRGLIAALLSQGAGAVSRGAAATADRIIKNITGMADATYTDVLTITVPNAAHAAALKLDVIASLGAGGAVGAFESSRAVQFLTAITRTPGLATAGPGGGFSSAAAIEFAVAGGTTIGVSAQTSGLTGGNGATQTFTAQLRITRGGGGSTNHRALVIAELLNSQASGITIT